MSSYEPYITAFSNKTLTSYFYVSGQAPGQFNWFSTNASGGQSTYGDGIPQSLILTAKVSQTKDLNITGTWTLTGTLYTVDVYGSPVSSTTISDSGSVSVNFYSGKYTITSAAGGIESGEGYVTIQKEKDGGSLYFRMSSYNFYGPGATVVANAWTSGPASAASDDTGSSSGQTVTGTDGNDTLEGTAGKDTITGGAGNDTIDGGAGNDKIYGGSGYDVIDGGEGADYMEGGSGSDHYYVDNAKDVIKEFSNIAADASGDTLGVDFSEMYDQVISTVTHTLTNYVEWLTLNGSSAINGTGNDENNLINGNEANNKLAGKAGNDELYGGEGNDALDGGDGNDILNGEEGADKLTGGAGDDHLAGGEGVDKLTGGAGNDTFYFDSSSAADADTITDFTEADFLALYDLLSATEDNLAIDKKAEDLDEDDYLIYSSKTGKLYYDEDANASEFAPILIVALKGSGSKSFDFSDMETG